MSSVRIPNKSGYDGKSSFHPDSDQRCILEDAILHSLLFTRSLGSVGERLVSLTPEMRYFLWKMLQCIISTQDRLHRMNKPIASSPLCVQCTAGEVDDIEHALLRCSKIKPGADFLLETLKSEIPDFTLERIKYLDFRSEDLLIPTYLTARDIVATLEFQILRKELLLAICSCKCGTEHFDAEKLTLAASKLHCMWNV